MGQFAKLSCCSAAKMLEPHVPTYVYLYPNHAYMLLRMQERV